MGIGRTFFCFEEKVAVGAPLVSVGLLKCWEFLSRHVLLCVQVVECSPPFPFFRRTLTMSMSVLCLFFLALLGETWGFSRGGSSLFRSVVPLRSSISDDEPLLRIGHGFDIHRLIEGTKLVIGGVEIPFKLGADAHSDGDAMYHSIVDAILGALTLPDIGQLFPDNDPNWKGADSSIFMEEAYRRMTDRGYRIGNVDVTLILQTPKVKDIKPAMKENIVRLLRTSDGRVNIKARTHEKVDSIGESRSYACHVVVLLEKIPK